MAKLTGIGYGVAMSSVGSGLIASFPQELVFEPFILHEKCPRVLHQVSHVKPQRGVPSPQVPVSRVTSPVDLGQLATWPLHSPGRHLLFSFEVSLLWQDPRFVRCPNRVGNPTIHNGPDWASNPTIPMVRTGRVIQRTPSQWPRR